MQKKFSVFVCTLSAALYLFIVTIMLKMFTLAVQSTSPMLSVIKELLTFQKKNTSYWGLLVSLFWGFLNSVWSAQMNKGWVLRPSTNSEFPVTPNDLRRFFWSKNFLKVTETCILVDLWKQTVLYVKCVSKSHITKTPPVVLCASFIHSLASSAVIMMRNSKAVLWGGVFWPRRGCCSNCSRAVSETCKLLGWC